MNDTLCIELYVLTGSGTPPQWGFKITDASGVLVTQMRGPRILVLETLARWVTLFEEISRPS